MPKSLLIYNPTAGPWDMTKALKKLAGDLAHHNWSMELVETEKSGDATWYAQQAARHGIDLVLVAGGDGTINEVANGIAGTETALGIVPAGTGNILAHQLRMPILSVVPPYQVSEVTEALLHSRIQRVDVGQLNGRYFMCWAGAGLDAEITVAMEPRSRTAKRLRTLPYIIAAFSVAGQFKGVRARISVEDRAFNTRALLILASNIQLYAAFFSVARHAYMDDGLLDIFVFKGLGTSYALRHFFHMLFGARHLHDPAVVQVLARSVQIETAPHVAVHLDGDPYGETPAIINLVPGALRFLVPPHAPGDLFSKPPERVL
ncbi:MAG: diacylglycerol kinase family lipid kinase [Anaerolineae bacterium]|nr:diacylglycerol kinase family lipid kinase [Anaerolineae bacterium]